MLARSLIHPPPRPAGTAPQTRPAQGPVRLARMNLGTSPSRWDRIAGRHKLLCRTVMVRSSYLFTLGMPTEATRLLEQVTGIIFWQWPQALCRLQGLGQAVDR